MGLRVNKYLGVSSYMPAVIILDVKELFKATEKQNQ